MIQKNHDFDPDKNASPVDIHGGGDEDARTAFPLAYFYREHQGMQDMNRELERLVLELEAKEQGQRRASMRGGYHSDMELLASDNRAIKQLGQLIRQDCARYFPHYWASLTPSPLVDLGRFTFSMYGWAMVMRAGNMSAPHLHPDSQISGVYYVCSPPHEDGIDAGQLILMDPRPRAVMSPLPAQPMAKRIRPIPGLIIMFPSWLEHYVAPFPGDGVRISIAFNIQLSGKSAGVRTY